MNCHIVGRSPAKMIASGSNKPYQKGFTLVELMIVVAIIAILSSIGYPLYSSYLSKARRAEAKAELMQIMQAEQRYFTANSIYVSNLTKLGYSSATVTTESKQHTIAAAACDSDIKTCVKLTATPNLADAECGNLIYDSTGTKRITGAESNLDKCWH
jgi:type IV pilus assembly protein PilE